MPRAFDQNPLNIDRDPLRNFIDLPNLPTLEVPDIFAICNQPFVTGLKLLGTGEGEMSKIATGIQNVIDTLFGTLFCNADTGLTPQTMFGSLGDLLGPILASPFVVGLVGLADWLGRATGTFLGDVFAGLIGLVDWVCGILTCNPAASGTTPQTLIDGFQAVLDPIISNPFIQGIIQFAEDIGVAVGNFALDLYNGILGIFEALCSLITTGTLPATYGSWSNTPQQILADLGGIVTTLLANPIIGGLRDLVTSSGSLLADTVSGLSSFISELVGLLSSFISGPQSILDLLGQVFGEDGFIGWLTTLPFIGPLVAKLTGADSSGDTALDLASLGNWAANLLTQGSSIPAANLFGSLPEAIFATIPVSSINFTAGNLLAQGAFANTNTVEAAGGWAWDSTTSATGGGGAAKAVATGALQQLYSRQTVKVAAGDRVDVSAMIKTAGFTSGSLVLSVVPWIGTAAQTPHVIHTRTASATTFTAMTGSRLRIGGTIEAGEVLLPSTYTALTVRLAVTANAGAQIWFDDIKLTKAGALAQTLVEFLTTTWEQAWNAVFVSGGAGKQWFDFVTAVSTIFTRAKLGVEKGDTANGNALGVIDSIGKAVFGEATFQNLPGQVKTSLQFFIGKLFGVSTVQNELTGDVLPPIDATTLTGDVPVANLPTEQLFPTAGSGALLVRTTSGAVNAKANFWNTVDQGFFNQLAVASTDVQCLRAGNVVGTGEHNDYLGAFRVTAAGWYMVELAYKTEPVASWGWNFAPVLFKGTSTPNVSGNGSTSPPASAFKVGTDVLYTWSQAPAFPPSSSGTNRFVQNSFIVYLNANEIVRAGYNVSIGAALGRQMLGSSSGSSVAETYFSISLLNKSF